MLKFSIWLESKDVIQDLRNALKKVKRDGQKDGLQVWWNPEQGKAFVSVGDWVETDDWFKAISAVVGKENVKGESESGPSGKGWVQVRDTHRIADSIKGMDEDRKRMVGL